MATFKSKKLKRNEPPAYVHAPYLMDSKTRINSYADAINTLDEVAELIAALENRCKVAEDLNKIYVRMYLEMQEKYDYLVKKTSEDTCCCTSLFYCP